MKATFIPATLCGNVVVPPSKSHLHRLLISAALSGENCFVPVGDLCRDVLSTANCLNNLFGNVEYSGGGYNFTRPLCANAHCELNFNESASTFRFLLPVVLALGIPCRFIFSPALERRLCDIPPCLVENGGTVTNNGCGGRLKSGEYRISGSSSSQYISGLLFALPLLKGDSTVAITGACVSRPYIDLTLEVLDNFGIEINKTSNGFYVKGGQKYKPPKKIAVQGDWSGGAFWLCAAAMGNKITVSGLPLNTFQGDAAILGILKNFGAYVSAQNNTVQVSASSLSGIDLSAKDTPDLVPVISLLAAKADGETNIFDIARLKNKESNRIISTVNMIKALGGNITCSNDAIKIIGTKGLNGGSVNCFGDHRIAMTAAVASTICKNPVTIDDINCVEKSYPRFFSDFQRLCGIMKGE